MPEKKVKKSFHTRRGLAQFDINKVVVEQTGVNPYFNSRYSTLDNLHKAIQDPLEKHGIYYTFRMCSMAESGRNILKLQIWDMQGGEDREEFEESCFMLPDESDMQKLGSSLTFASRYLLISAFLLKPDFDDDANLATGKTQTKMEKEDSVLPSKKKEVVEKSPGLEHDYWFEDKYMFKFQKLCQDYKINKEQLLARVKDRYKTARGTAVESLEDLKFLKKEVKEKLHADIITGFMDVSTATDDADLTDEGEQDEFDDIPF